MNDRDPRILSRRRLLLGAGLGAGALLTGCTSGTRALVSGFAPSGLTSLGGVDPQYVSMYGPVEDDGHFVPAINLRRVNPIYYRQEVIDPTGERPGTVVVDTAAKFAFVVLPGGRAMRYGVGVGREGFGWSGRANVQWKRRWPTWTPPREMIDRKPELAEYATGMEGGIMNPLGARALYLFQDGRDTLYRLHGSPEYWTIGTADSSGCVRFMNQDIIDLYDRVPTGSPVIVTQGVVA